MRVLVVGWYLFARSGMQQAELMAFLIGQSKASVNQRPESELQLSYLDKLLTTKAHMSGIELFSLRFNYYPPSFYPLEVLTKSSVTSKILGVGLKQLPSDYFCGLCNRILSKANSTVKCGDCSKMFC